MPLTDTQIQSIINESVRLSKKVPTVDEKGSLAFVYPVKGKGKTTKPKNLLRKRKKKRKMTKASRRKNRG